MKALLLITSLLSATLIASHSVAQDWDVFDTKLRRERWGNVSFARYSHEIAHSIIVDELSLTDSQLAKFQKTADLFENEKAAADAHWGSLNLPNVEDDEGNIVVFGADIAQERYKQNVLELETEHDHTIKEILTPDQRRRLAQVILQLSGEGSTFGVYSSNVMENVVGLSSDQRKKLEAAILALMPQYDRERVALENRYHQKIREAAGQGKAELDRVLGVALGTQRQHKLTGNDRLFTDEFLEWKMNPGFTALFRNYEVVRDIELSEEQIAEHKRLAQTRSQNTPRSGNGWEEVAREQFEIYCDGLAKILLMHQRRRLEQLTIQIGLNRPHHTPFEMYANEDLARFVNLTEQQLRAVKQAAASSKRDYGRDLLKLRSKYHDQVRSVLGEEIKAEIDQLLGPPIIANLSK